jgi:hypothetical protein
MADPVVHNDVVVTNKIEKTKTVDKGIVTSTLYKGTKAKIEAKFNELSAIVDSLDDLRVKWGGGGPAELEVTQGNNTEDSGGGTDSGQIQIYWEIDSNTINDPVENNDYWDAADQYQKALAIKEYRDAKKATTATDQYAKQLFDDCLMKGQEYVLTYNVALRLVQVCASGSNIKPSFAKTFEVWALSDIMALNPATYIEEALETLSFEYLKQPPRIRQISKTRYQITTEFWGAPKFAGAFYKGGTGKPTKLT